MYIKNDQLVIKNVLREEFNEGSLSTSGLAHDDHRDSGLHPQINYAHFEEVICSHHVFIIRNL
jgi:hypothetical protein